MEVYKERESLEKAFASLKESHPALTAPSEMAKVLYTCGEDIDKKDIGDFLGVSEAQMMRALQCVERCI